MLRREAWQEARRLWRQLIAFLAAWAALTVALTLMQRTTFLRGFATGFMVGGLGYIAMMILVATGIAQRRMGGLAEQWTADVFQRLDRGRWFVAHDVSFEKMNVDHVLVGPGRIYAVETKWTSSQGDRRFLEGAQGCAERGARKLRRLLASRGVRREVIPLVVVWGPGTSNMQHEPVWDDGVGVVGGVHADVWLSSLRSSGRSVARDLAAERALTHFMEERDRYGSR